MDGRRGAGIGSVFQILLGSGARLFLLLIILAIFIPSSPLMPLSGLDNSWVYGMNQAVAQGLQFGRDVLFTFGPYAAVFTRTYHPATDLMSMIAGAGLGFSFATAIVILVRSVPCGWMLALGALLVQLQSATDCLLLTAAVLPALVCYRLTLPEGHPLRVRAHRGQAWLVVPLCLPLGLLPLIKASLFPAVLVMLCMCWFVCVTGGRRALGHAMVAGTAVVMLGFWVGAGQSPWILPHYVFGSLPLISGYSEAMSLPELPWHAIAYCMVAAGLLVVASREADAPLKSRAFLVLVFSAYLFLAFKAGFVRGDGHAEIAGAVLAFAPVLLALVSRSAVLPVLFFAALLGYANIDRTITNSSTREFFVRAQHLVSSTESGIRGRLGDPAALKNAFYERRKAIAAERSIPTLPGTTDIYSHGQAGLLASGNAWSPRPVFQSYAAYSPELAQRNAAHLNGAAAPENILFRVEPIDRRLASLEDGLSWPIIIHRYMPVKFIDDTLYLKRRAGGSLPPPLALLSKGQHSLGEAVNLPASETPLYAEITLRKGLLGSLVGLLYKPAPLEIELVLSGGEKQSHRLVASMAGTHFLLSPLVQNTTDFTFLFGEPSHLKSRRVLSMRVFSSGRLASLWNSQYDLALYRGALPASGEPEKLFAYDPFLPQAPAPGHGQEPVACTGVIDLVRGRPPGPAPIGVWRDLPISGWLMVEESGATVRPDVFVSITGKSGDAHYIRARQTPRDDVKLAHKRPAMPDPGYEVRVDVSKLSGRYEVGVGFMHKGKLVLCKQLNQAILIDR